MILLEGKNLDCAYENGDVLALQNVSFQVFEGRCTLFLGKSGSGKTSLLKCIANLNDAYHGEISYKNQSIRSMTRQERVRAIGYVAQAFHLFSNMSVLQNCIHPQIHVLKIDSQLATQTAKKTLANLEIEHLSERLPRELSGGQQQRVAIARALCMQSKVLLFDEPTSALDPDSTEQLYQIIKMLLTDKITIIISTHDMLFAKKVLDHAYFLQNGKIVESFDARAQKLSSNGFIDSFLNRA